MPQVDIEGARRSWQGAPDAHVLQAIGNMDCYEPEVRGIITEEAERRFSSSCAAEGAHPSVQTDASSAAGIGRLNFFCLILFTAIIGGFFTGIVRVVETERSVPSIAGLFIPAVLAYARFKNIGWKGWWALLAAIPGVSVLVVWVCLILPEGYQSTKRIDRAGKIAACVTVGLLLLAVAALLMQ